MELRAELNKLIDLSEELALTGDDVESLKDMLDPENGTLSFWNGKGRDAYANTAKGYRQSLEELGGRLRVSAAVLAQALEKYTEEETVIKTNVNRLSADGIF